jgi:sialic acid synthase SpsE
MEQIAQVKIGDKMIGTGQPIYTIADVGLTNGGNMDFSLQLIEIAKDLGVDAIKFQMIGPEYLLGDRSIEYTYPTLNDGPKTENMFEMFSDMSYTPEEWKRIARAAKDAGLEFICTAHYMGAVDILEECEVNCHKICSWSVTHKRLIQKIGRTGKSMLMDMGTSGRGNLANVIDWHAEAGGRGLVILHDFHTNNTSEMNFRNIPFITEHFACPVGYTPQGRDFAHDYMAVGLGAHVLEKRLTHDRSIPKNGYVKSLDPDEFKEWLKTIKDLEQSLGSATIQPTVSDLEQAKKYFKSIFVKQNLRRGDMITDDMVDGMRPGVGISTAQIDSIVGRRVCQDIAAGTMLSWEMLS